MHREIIERWPAVKGFGEHGVVFHSDSSGQLRGDCPFNDCGREGHFYVNPATRLWDCKACGRKGGLGAFFKYIASDNLHNAVASRGVLSRLAADRGLHEATLRKWGIGWSGSFYTIPVRSLDLASEHLIDLRQYRTGQKSRCSSGGKIGLVGVERMAQPGRIWLCEGEWDAMAMDEMLSAAGRRETALGLTGAEQFRPEWGSTFTGRDVVVAFDNDDAGIRGENKVNTALRGACKSLRFIHWPVDGPRGFDLRDYYRDGGNLAGLSGLIHDGPRTTLVPVSGDVEAAAPANMRPGGTGMSAEDVLAGYQKWLCFPNPEPLEILFGSVLANRLVGDPLWMFMVAPAGGCKSELLMSLEKAPLVITASSLTPHSLVSGANFSGGGDPSLIPKLDGKVLVIKDFTVILSMHYAARDEIFSVLRDAYDGRTEKVFGTGVHRTYNSRFGIIAGVTPIIEQFTSVNSALGERFLRYHMRVTGGVGRAADQIRRAITNSVTVEDRGRVALKELVAQALDVNVDPNKPPKMDALMVRRFTALAQWTATLRGVVMREKYTGEIPFRPMVEIGTRLGKQLAKLAMGVALFNRRDVVNVHDFKLAARVARDTVPEIVDEIIHVMYSHCIDGFCPTAEVAEICRIPNGTALRYLQDLHMLGAMTKDPSSPARGGWALSNGMIKLMNLLDLYAV